MKSREPWLPETKFGDDDRHRYHPLSAHSSGPVNHRMYSVHISPIQFLFLPVLRSFPSFPLFAILFQLFFSQFSGGSLFFFSFFFVSHRAVSTQKSKRYSVSAASNFPAFRFTPEPSLDCRISPFLSLASLALCDLFFSLDPLHSFLFPLLDSLVQLLLAPSFSLPSTDRFQPDQGILSCFWPEPAPGLQDIPAWLFFHFSSFPSASGLFIICRFPASAL